ncbi:TIGR02391 family protein [Mycobacterium marseillense]|uniref:Conserved hypothetical protein CHP02391 domain-containing protein n=1 Tax=Mycobacterium marseillense TaxID=701042 RepID=A0ABM7JB53_9MYCO|nr:TIGR02391 family protein [Mycobacterium marseillense]MCV7405591.1 TIGR02391 family protein [Mycobacterium marseillense]ORA94170.1 TIGR02391 family protein [Mycobacterium marseillense]BBY11012.1 hypothetical protein MMARJ_17520 [Mycobacterium marseillense]
MAGFLSRLGGPLGIQKVVVIRDEGSPNETRTETEAHIQAQKGFFEVETQIYEGDIVEMDDPRGGHERRLVDEVQIYHRPRGGNRTNHIEVVWGKIPRPTPPRSAPVRRLDLENLHQHVTAVASDLFNEQFYGAAVAEAFKSIEVRVRDLTGGRRSGAQLMGDAFGGAVPQLDVSVETGRSAEDEREGFLALFRGAMIGVRNPGAHELFKQTDPQQALEYLGFASLLHRRIDVAAAKQSGQST